MKLGATGGAHPGHQLQGLSVALGGEAGLELGAPQSGRVFAHAMGVQRLEDRGIAEAKEIEPRRRIGLRRVRQPRRHHEQIAALQKQVDVMRREQLLMQQNTRESLAGGHRCGGWG